MDELNKNDILEAVCSGYASDGSGVARIGGRAVFVSGAIAGERCRVRVLKVLKNAAFAKVEDVISPSPERAAPDCPHYPACGGCAVRHMSYPEELRFKRQKVEDALLRIGGVDLKLSCVHPARDISRYRNKVQFPVVPGPKIGFYRARSHDVIDVPDCLLQPGCAANIRAAVKSWMERSGVPAYDERTHTGLLRHLYVRSSSTGKCLVCLVVNAPADRRLPNEPDLIDLIRDFEPNAIGVVLSSNTARTNVILGTAYRTLWGSDTLNDTLRGLTFRLSVPSFFQVNRDMCEVLYSRAISFAGLTGTQTVLDLYCGIGTVSLCMAGNSKRVIGCEIVPEAVEDAKENARLNGITNAEFICGDAGAVSARLAREGARPDVITVDPPRKGLSPETVAAIAQMSPDKIVYISCDPATLARDIKLLKTHSYTPRTAESVDLFPRTEHIETVALLTRP